eukprot:5638006-Amphidinium_carterae.1
MHTPHKHAKRGNDNQFLAARLPLQVTVAALSFKCSWDRLCQCGQTLLTSCGPTCAQWTGTASCESTAAQ